uniref:F-box domain-containing protein n=1 Tax=Ditylenchus dipsaci TaxID=166011 RepID=A0A915DZD4_9BILA
MGKRKRNSQKVISADIPKKYKRTSSVCGALASTSSSLCMKDYINRLANDELAIIFQNISFLDRLNAELVCKRWKKVAMNPKCWSNFREISFSEFYSVKKDVISKDSKLARSFIENHLYGVCNTRVRFHISIDKLTYLFKRCDKFIKELNFDRLSHSALFNPDSLAVSGVGLDASEGLNLLLKQSTHLEYFRIQECHIRFHSHRSVDCSNLVIVAASNCNQLITLVLRDWYNVFGYDEQMFEAIAQIKTLQHFLMDWQNYAQLQEVDLMILQLISKHCQQLNYLDLTLVDCDVVANKDLFAFFTEIPCLFIGCKHRNCSTFPTLLAELLEQRACSTTLKTKNHLFWTDECDYDRICQAMDKIHNGKQNLGYSTEKKIFDPHPCYAFKPWLFALSN